MEQAPSGRSENQLYLTCICVVSMPSNMSNFRVAICHRNIRQKMHAGVRILQAHLQWGSTISNMGLLNSFQLKFYTRRLPTGNDKNLSSNKHAYNDKGITRGPVDRKFQRTANNQASTWLKVELRPNSHVL